MSVHSQRRHASLALLSVLFVPALARGQQRQPQIDVYKSPTRGCCNDWITHLEANGFSVRPHDVADSRQYRARFGMPHKYGSCHTGLIDAYVVEGHVPAREIKRLLRERPNALGIAVQGMPIGSPGMDTPSYNGHVDPYDVLLVQADGRAAVYASYEPPAQR